MAGLAIILQNRWRYFWACACLLLLTACTREHNTAPTFPASTITDSASAPEKEAAIPPAVHAAQPTDSKPQGMPDNWGYKTAHKAQLKTIMANPCAIDSLIFEDLYDGPQAIADDATERSILVQKLKQQGFHQTGWGRGNWMEGPRIVAYAFANDQCTCSVYKLYYSPEIEGKCRVAEEIHCSDKK